MVEVAYITNMGYERDHNEDSILIENNLINNISQESITFQNEDFKTFAVADGMGGHAKGEVASGFLLEYIKENIGNINSEENTLELLDSIQEAFKTKGEDPEFKDMGTTLSGIKIDEDLVHIFSVGDSRVYRVIGGYLERLTKDHSLVERMVDMGLIDIEEMRFHPKKATVTSAFVARNEKLEEKFYRSIPYKKDEVFLIVSDGIWEALSLDEMEEAIGKDIEKSCENLYNKAIENKCKDNISIILVKV